MFTFCDAQGVGERIKAARIRRDLTQEVLAEKVGVEHGTISMIETGKREPSLDVLVRIMNQLRVEPNLIFCENPYTEENDRKAMMAKDIITIFDLYNEAEPPGKDG